MLGCISLITGNIDLKGLFCVWKMSINLLYGVLKIYLGSDILLPHKVNKNMTFAVCSIKKSLSCDVSGCPFNLLMQ